MAFCIFEMPENQKSNVGLDFLTILQVLFMSKVLNQIVFEYADNVVPSKEREEFLLNQAKLWFEPLVNEINSQSGTIHFFLNEGDENRVHFSGINQDLEDKMNDRVNLFKNPY